MRWIRMSNSGSFDLEKRLKFAGASVKVKDNAIGQFGDGSLYSYSLACRLNLSMKIASNGNIYTLATLKDKFREKEFDVVAFKTQTGKVIRSPFVVDLGHFDWDQKFFVLRELYSNMLDENGEMDLVDGIQVEPNKTHVFLCYSEFKEEYDNIKDYFKDESHGTLKIGTGRVYKKGVYVGTIPDMKIDMWDDYVKITESRTMLMESAETCLRDRMEECKDETVWKAFFESKKSGDIRVYDRTVLREPIDKALKSIYGNNYLICPNVQGIIKDCVAEGFTPVIFSDKWDLNGLKLPSYLDKVKDIGCRALNDIEQVLVDKALNAIKWLTGDKVFEIKVIQDTELSRLGDVNLSTGLIRLSEEIFKDYKKLVETIIHETGHILSGGFGDYQRGFVDYFVSKLAEVSI